MGNNSFKNAMLQNHAKAKYKIKIVFKYILILVVLPYLCALMIPLLAALLLLAGLHETIQSAYMVIALMKTISVIACAASGFIMALLISLLAKNKEIIMSMVGALIVAIIYLCTYFSLYMTMNSNDILEGTWKYLLLEIGIDGITLFISALIGAWLVVKKRRAKTQTDNDQQNDPQNKPQPLPIPENTINL